MPLPASASLALNRWRRRLRRHRRGVTTSCALVSLFCGLQAVAPSSPPTVRVLVAATDLAGGRTLTSADLRLARLPPTAEPSGSLDDPVQARGRVLAAPMRRGEPITDVRLVGQGLLGALGPGLVAVPVRVADAASVSLVTAGERVDLLAAPADPTGRPATVVASAVRVLVVPPSSDAGGLGSTDGTDGALLVVAATRPVALALAAAATSDRLSLSLLPG